MRITIILELMNYINIKYIIELLKIRKFIFNEEKHKKDIFLIVSCENINNFIIILYNFIMRKKLGYLFFNIEGIRKSLLFKIKYTSYNR